MKTKILVAFCLLTVLLSLSMNLPTKGLDTNIVESKTKFPRPPERSNEELYKDIFITLLLPYIDDEIENYYGKSYSVDPWTVNIIDITRLNGYRTFLFLITLEVSPYTGPHNTVGIDNITFKVSSGDITVENFEHIETLGPLLK
ncbi:DUF3888 domain-containing protein [Vallitalea okinawensis]|uniref:DUF3888 domain-containing protein n=1 Tax=Vallitalea okinawensis TaxID=2078660 RepID=UPI000CFE054D|nr:DUF3888 domain-containing protein [Vallitalea okinawensis]